MNRKPIVFMFSGQGSQYYQMGKDFYQSFMTFRSWMDRLDSYFNELTGDSVVHHLYHPDHARSDPFVRLLYTHPAIFMVEYALAQLLMEQGIQPAYVLGYSLGEVTAAVVSGALHYATAMRGLIKQAQIIEALCQESSMLAIMYDEKLFTQDAILYQNAELAARNFSSHFVVAASNKNISTIEMYIAKKDILYQRLPIPFAFHSSLIDPAAVAIIDQISTQTYQTPHLHYISCLTTGPITSLTSDHFWRVMRNMVNFSDTLTSLEKDQPLCYVDLGPSGTLATFAKYLLGRSKQGNIYTALTPFNRDSEHMVSLIQELAQ